MSEQKFVSDVIGTEYKNQWGIGDTIFINAPTGSGKSHFVLHTLLDHVVSNFKKGIGGKILYLVNRKVLKEQIEQEINSSVAAEMYEKYGEYLMEKYITVHTYQHIENQIKDFPTLNQMKTALQGYSYIVYDECHYFYADSNFNTKTELSFNFLQRNFVNKIQIFISATLKNVEELIIDKGKRVTFDLFKAHHFNPYRPQGHSLDSVLTYEIERKYDFIRIHTFNKQEDLKFIIQKNISKNDCRWLIFTDSIKNGKKLRRELISNSDEDKKGLSKDDVVFIDAEYEKDKEASKSINTLVNEGYVDKKVIIATPVLDNGISFFDNQLRNIVILSDTEEEFIQMLGRKRKDEEKIDLYICKRSVDYFKNRKAYVEKIFMFLNRYYGYYQYILRRLKPLWERRGETDSDLLMQNPLRNELLAYRQTLLNDIFSNALSYEFASKVCYAFNGEIWINEFAVKRVMNLKFFYAHIIDEMEKDENAFLRMQMEWLNKSIEEIDEIVATAEEEMENQERNKLEQKIAQALDEVMEKEQCIEFKKTNKTSLIYFLDRSILCQSDEKKERGIGKNEKCCC